jgi:predicted RNA binding protein YcfA (HicA-like mRNA interferase family)
MSRYRKGWRNEKRTIKLLEAAGFECIRSAGSRGVFDVVGISSRAIVLVQVKSNNPPSPATLETIREFPAPDNAHKLVHVWNNYSKMPEVIRV